MPDISRAEVVHLADLARIDLGEDEIDRLVPQLQVILESVASIQAAADDDVPATSHPMPLSNVFRDDVERACLSAQEALGGAPRVEQQRFEVPRILGDEQ